MGQVGCTHQTSIIAKFSNPNLQVRPLPGSTQIGTIGALNGLNQDFSGPAHPATDNRHGWISNLGDIGNSSAQPGTKPTDLLNCKCIAVQSSLSDHRPFDLGDLPTSPFDQIRCPG